MSRADRRNATARASAAPQAPERSRSVAVLRAVRVTTERLFGDASWRGEVDAMIERLGLAAGLSHVSVVERAPQEGSSEAAVHRWNAPGISAVGGDRLGDGGDPKDPFTEAILEAFRHDECFQGSASDRPDPDRSGNATHGTVAFALAPIVVEGELWGMMRFFDGVAGRSWSPSELDALRVAAALLGAAIGNGRVQADHRMLAERLQAILDAQPECVSIVAADVGLIEMNPAGLRMIEADDLDEVRGKDVSVLVVEEDRKAFRAAIVAASAGRTTGAGFEIVGLKGTHRWLEATHAPLRDASDQIEAVLSVTRDVSDRHRAEEELRESLSVLRALSEERRALLGRLDRAQEDERARISEDIHDDSIQAMTALGFRLERLGRIVGEPEAIEIVDRLKDQVSATIGRLRRLSFELRPPVLDDGLAPALRALLDQMREQSGIDYRVRSTMAREPETPARSILYRISQEALVNVRKHSDAHRVDILLSETGEGFTVTIADDGKGFAANGSGHSPLGHLGLTAMRDRAERAGGSWRIDSTPGEGTTVEFAIPQEPAV